MVNFVTLQVQPLAFILSKAGYTQISLTFKTNWTIFLNSTFYAKYCCALVSLPDETLHKKHGLPPLYYLGRAAFETEQFKGKIYKAGGSGNGQKADCQPAKKFYTRAP